MEEILSPALPLKKIQGVNMSDKSMKDYSSGIDPDVPINVGDDDIQDVVKRWDTVVVDCWAPWCGPCRMIAPTIDTLATEYKGKVVFGKLNTDENQKSARDFQVMGIPTLLVFNKGELVDKIVGVLPKNQIEEKISKYL